MESLTTEQRAKYIADRGEHCPFCGDFRIEGDSVYVDIGTAWQDITCTECRKSWRDLYTLTGIEEA